MKSFTISLISSVCVLTALVLPQMSRAQSVPLIFHTTFDIPAWTQGGGLNPDPPGDGINHRGDWTSSSGSVDEITVAANNPLGSGKGFRHYRGNGSNNGGGGLDITLPFPVTEVWVRLYMRYQAGMAWLDGAPYYTKDNYWGGCGSGCIIFGIQGSSINGRSWGINYNNGVNYPSSMSWAMSQGGPTGDGKWHAYEYHVKKAGPNSVLELWVDGVRYLHKTGIDLGTTPMYGFGLGENQTNVTGCNPDCYTDYDDIAISTTGYIGPIGGAPPSTMPAPQRLRFQP